MPQNIEEQLREYRRKKEAEIQMSSKESMWERFFPSKTANVFRSEITNKKVIPCFENAVENISVAKISDVVVVDNEGLSNSSTPGKTILHRPGFSEKSQSQEALQQEQSGRKTKAGRRNLSVQQVAADNQNGQFKYVLLCLKIILWMVLYLLCLELEFGALYVILSAFYLIFTNFRTGQRKPWEPSAYSVFNPGCEAIDGSLKPEQFEKEIRYGF
ncbi:SAYSvFN domain-containing protein 1-like [Daphnia carinata]|uniref:SAYSvFN domain-containing protein 1-like n=1 Tax=Daphnia carinata TaxID=120202 RepID=UPI00257E9A27|nr:SAYSvFN domain-containing protein 1-like [Daphnia carinata]